MTDCSVLIEKLKKGLPCYPDPCNSRDARSCLCFEAGETIESLVKEINAAKEKETKE